MGRQFLTAGIIAFLAYAGQSVHQTSFGEEDAGVNAALTAFDDPDQAGWAFATDEPLETATRLSSPSIASLNTSTSLPTGGAVPNPYYPANFGQEIYGNGYTAYSQTPHTCGPSCDKCRQARFSVRTELLTWWSKGGELPPLVTTSPNGTARADAGVLGTDFVETSTASILFGNDDIDTDERAGGRIHLAYLLHPRTSWTLGGDFFALGDGTDSFSATSDGSTILARPFLNVDGVPQQDAELVAFPNVISGTVAVRAENDVLGAGTYLSRSLLRCNGRRVDFLAGYRFLRLDDYLSITEDLVAGPNEGSVAQGTTFNVLDEFDIENQFHGGEIGLLYEVSHDRWALSMLSRVAFGATWHDVRINGGTLTVVPGTPPSTSTSQFGLLAQQTNSGEFENNDFAVLPEVTVNLAVCLSKHWKANVGYTFMYLSNIARAGEQIDLAVNGQLLDGNFPVDPARPQFALDTTSLWLQGINFGLDFQY